MAYAAFIGPGFGVNRQLTRIPADLGAHAAAGQAT
jgi:hypothetical protein